jgi:hypothetical protein
LWVQLEICRLRAELEAVEEQLAAARRPVGADGLASPFADRAALLVDRLAVTLQEAVEEEDASLLVEAERQAAARVEAGRQQAQMVLAAARADLAASLEARAEAVELEHRRWRVAYRGWEQLHQVRGTSLAVEVQHAAELLGIEVSLGRTEPASPARPAPASAGTAEAPAPVAAVVPAGLAPLPPPAPLPTDDALVAEAARTDAAFEAWMAVAPNRAATAAGDQSATVPDGGRRWGLPLEVAASLVAVAVVVVVLLIALG